MRRIIVDAVFIIILFLLQCTIFQKLALAGVVPNLLIVITASCGFMHGKTEGLLVGFFSGLLIDVFYGDLFCFYALIYMYIGYTNGFFHSLFYPIDVKLPMILISVSELFYGLIIYLFMFLLRNRLHFSYYFLHVIFPELIYTIVVTIVLYRIILAVSQWADRIGKRGENKIVE